MYYTPEPPIFIVVECPPFATDAEIASLVNAEIPDEKWHFSSFASPYGMMSGDAPYDTAWIEYTYDDLGRIVRIEAKYQLNGEGPTYVWSTKKGGKYLFARYRSIAYDGGCEKFAFTDDLSYVPGAYPGGDYMHPYTDVYVTL